MSENCWQNGDSSNVNPTPNLPPSSGGNSPNKPPRPPPPKFARPSSIDEHLEHLRPLKPERVRWFWKEDKKWVPFNGCDSLAIESCYRHISELELKVEDPTKPLNSPRIYDLPTVKGRLYKVDVVARECTPIYWKGIKSKFQYLPASPPQSRVCIVKRKSFKRPTSGSHDWLILYVNIYKSSL